MGNWTLNTTGVVLDVFSITGFDGFTLMLGDRVYSTQNGQNVWPVTGTWDFKTNSLIAFIRDDGVENSLNIISDNEIVVSFIYPDGSSCGRYSGISGHYIFYLKK